MRSSLETIAEEARDNQWKSALKNRECGNNDRRCRYRDCRGCTQVGFVVGQAVGDLVEQGGNELISL